MADKVTATPEALHFLAEIVADHGPVMFHQSGGCCDGSSPMCYPQGEFLVGDRDVKLGEIGGAPFYISEFAIRGVEAHRPHHRRRAGPRRHVLPGQWPRAPLPHPVDDVRAAGSRRLGRRRERAPQNGADNFLR